MDPQLEHDERARVRIIGNPAYKIRPAQSNFGGTSHLLEDGLSPAHGPGRMQGEDCLAYNFLQRYLKTRPATVLVASPVVPERQHLCYPLAEHEGPSVLAASTPGEEVVTSP